MCRAAWGDGQGGSKDSAAPECHIEVPSMGQEAQQVGLVHVEGHFANGLINLAPQVVFNLLEEKED